MLSISKKNKINNDGAKMSTEHANLVLVVSTTAFHAYIVYASIFWFANNCECI